jgi:hypothetical protein
MRKTLLAFAITSLFVSSAFAQNTPTSQEGRNTKNASTVSYKDRTDYSFDDDVLEGSVLSPDVEIVTSRQKTKHDSLVKPRRNFMPELLSSVDFL